MPTAVAEARGELGALKGCTGGVALLVLCEQDAGLMQCPEMVRLKAQNMAVKRFRYGNIAGGLIRHCLCENVHQAGFPAA